MASLPPTRLVVAFVALLTCLAAGPFASASTVSIVNDISDLDLAGVVKAVSFRGDAADVTLDVNGTTFIGVTNSVTKDGVTQSSGSGMTTISGNGGTAPTVTGGNATETGQLNTIYNTIALGNSHTITVVLANGNYKVQLLLADGFLSFNSNRIADITVEGLLTGNLHYGTAQGNTNANGALLTEFVTVLDGILNISMVKDVTSNPGDSPHISGLIINSVTAVPEPASLGLLSLASLALVRRRRA